MNQHITDRDYYPLPEEMDMKKQLRERMYELAIAACKGGMTVREAAETYMVDQAILACRVAA